MTDELNASPTPSQDSSNSIFVGISFGTLNSTIALVGKNGEGEIIANEDGDRNIPSCVVFTAHEVLVGTQAKIQSISCPKGTIVEFRNILGKSFADEDVQEQQRRLPMNIIDSSKGPVYSIEPRLDPNGEVDENANQDQTVVEVSALYLKKLKETAESYLGKTVEGIVISVPCHFEELERKDLFEAVQKAGFKIIHTIHEPMAACLAFSKAKNLPPVASKMDQNMVVLDLGGHQFNVSCLSSNKGQYSVLSSVDDTKLGGVHFDKVLVQHFQKEFYRKTKIDISDSRKAISKLFSASERAKRSLSRQDVAPCSVDSLFDGMDFHGTINRGRFEMLAEPLFQRCIQVIQSAMNEAGWTPTQVDQVFFVGGASRMPRFQSLVRSLFEGHESSAVLRTDVEPDEAISIGCAIHAGLITKHENYASDSIHKEIVHAKALSNSIGIALGNGSFEPILVKRTPLPARRSIKFQSPKDNEKVYIALYEGDQPVAKENTLLSEMVIDTTNASPVELTLTIENDGILHVVANSSGNQVKMTIPSA